MDWRCVCEGCVSAPLDTFTVASSSFLREFGWEACILADSSAYLCPQVQVPPFPDSPKPSAMSYGGTDLLHRALQYGQEFL